MTEQTASVRWVIWSFRVNTPQLVYVHVKWSWFDRCCGLVSCVFSHDNLPAVADGGVIKSFEYSFLWESLGVFTDIFCLQGSFSLNDPSSVDPVGRGRPALIVCSDTFAPSFSLIFQLHRARDDLLWSAEPSLRFLENVFICSPSSPALLPRVTKRESFQRNRLFLDRWQWESLLGMHFPLQVVQLQFIQWWDTLPLAFRLG